MLIASIPNMPFFINHVKLEFIKIDELKPTFRRRGDEKDIYTQKNLKVGF